MLQFGHDDDDRELLKGIDIERDKWNNVKLAPIIKRIIQMGFPVKDNLISYYSMNERLFVFVGKEPLADDFSIPSEDIDPN
jgi:hypothetical protein